MPQGGDRPFYSRTYHRVIRSGLLFMSSLIKDTNHKLTRAFNQFDRAVADYLAQQSWFCDGMGWIDFDSPEPLIAPLHAVAVVRPNDGKWWTNHLRFRRLATRSRNPAIQRPNLPEAAS
jgi:hypothetical protein